jgi:hypothetical protein
MKAHAIGTVITARDKNIMKFKLSADMEITIEGFDRNKDLKANVKLPKTK